MPELPVITGSDAVGAFQKAGFVISRQAGSHVILKKAGRRYHLSIPCHGRKPLGRGLLKKQIALAGLTVDQFRKFL